MASLKLKRFLRARKPLRSALEALIELHENPFWICDQTGKVLLGDGDPVGDAHPIERDSTVLGHVHARQGAPQILSIIHGFLDLETEKRDLANEVLDRYRELTLLYDMAAHLTECKDIAGVTALVLREANKVAPSDWGAVMLLVNDTLTTVAHIGTVLERPEGSTLINRVALTGRAEMIDDTGADQTLRGWIAAPIKARVGVMGILVLGNHAPQVYTSGNLKLVTSLAGQVAPVIESARLTDAQRTLASSFARFVPDEFLGALKASSVVEIDTGEHARKKMSVFFSDIRSFTTLVEGKTPEENYRFINEYLSHLEPAIRLRSGFVAEVIGDAIMALFDEGGADDAVQAAIACQEALTAYNMIRGREGEPPVVSGFGISTGQLMLGTIGSPERIKCGVIGDTVNTAARVEGLTKLYDAGILISHHTRDELTDPNTYFMRPVDRVRAKGKQQPITLYEVMDPLPVATRESRFESLETYLEGWRLYQAGQPGEALVYFANAMNIDPSDRVSRLYLGRCWNLLEHGMPDNWDGIAQVNTK